MLLAAALLGLVVLAFDLLALLAIVGSDETEAGKLAWALVVILMPVVGLAFWALTGPRLAEAA